MWLKEVMFIYWWIHIPIPEQTSDMSSCAQKKVSFPSIENNRSFSIRRYKYWRTKKIFNQEGEFIEIHKQIE